MVSLSPEGHLFSTFHLKYPIRVPTVHNKACKLTEVIISSSIMEEIILHINVPACNRNMQGMEGRLKILTYSMLLVRYCTNIFRLTCNVFPDFLRPHMPLLGLYIRNIWESLWMFKAENGLFLAVIVHRGGKYLSRSASVKLQKWCRLIS